MTPGQRTEYLQECRNSLSAILENISDYRRHMNYYIKEYGMEAYTEDMRNMAAELQAIELEIQKATR